MWIVGWSHGEENSQYSAVVNDDGNVLKNVDQDECSFFVVADEINFAFLDSVRPYNVPP